MLFILFDIEAIFLYPWVVVLPRTEDVRLFRNVDLCRFGFVRIFLHLEKGRAGLVGASRTANHNRIGMLPENLKEHGNRGGMEVFDADAIVTGKFDRGELTLEIAPGQDCTRLPVS